MHLICTFGCGMEVLEFKENYLIDIFPSASKFYFFKVTLVVFKVVRYCEKLSKIVTICLKCF